MKKVLILTLGLFVMLVGVTACGGGAEEQDNKALEDSLRNDSIQKAMEEQRIADSIQAHIDSLNAAMDSMSNVEPKTIYINNNKNDGGDEDGGDETATPPANETPTSTNTQDGKDGRTRGGVENNTGKDSRSRGDGTNKTGGDGGNTSGKSGRTRGR